MEHPNDASTTTTGRAKGGHARANSLTSEERSEIARKGAESRWAAMKNQKVLRATHDGDLKLGETTLDVAVLEDGTRVVSERGLVKSFGGKRGGAHWRRMKADPDGANLPPILSANNLRSIIDNDLLAALNERILYRVKGGRPAYGRRAELYPKICEVFLRARDARLLKGKGQTEMANAADILIRALAHTGIIALVDEATGYQEIRDRDALQKILDQYIGKELAKWAERFPKTFYEQMFRLKGWTYNPNSSKRPMQMAQITVDLVFDRIGPGLTKDLRAKRNEIRENTGKTGRLHQVMTTDVGHPALAHHLAGLEFTAKTFSDGDWDGFYRAVDRAAPKYNRTLLLPFEDGV